jgi:GTP-binding protein
VAVGCDFIGGAVRRSVGDIDFIGSFPGALPDIERPEVAFAGRSNVGKSSMLNRLLNRKKVARVSSTPGRTTTINLFRVGEALTVVDLPGYGFAKVPNEIKKTWKGMMENYFENRDQLKLVVVLVDARRDALKVDAELIDYLILNEIPTLVVATKVDKLKRSKRGAQLKKIRIGHGLDFEQLIPFSSLNGEGREEVWDAIEGTLG